MTLEIPEITAPPFSVEESITEYRPLSQIPRGIGAVPDSIALSREKPPFLFRAALTFGICFIYSSIWIVQGLSWLFRSLFDNHPTHLYYHLHTLALEEKKGELQGFLEHHSKGETSIHYLLSELKDLPEVHPHLKEMLQGANISFSDGGFFCHRWKEHRESYPRISSHKYQGNHCYALDHLLFWLDEKGDTRCQFEATPLNGLLNRIKHFCDYLFYLRDEEQQGVAGSSPHTEKEHLLVPINIAAFKARKENL